jgi:hypothetical protein
MSEKKEHEGAQGDNASLTQEYLRSGEPRTHLRSGGSPLFKPSPPAHAEGDKALGSPARPHDGPGPQLLPSHSESVMFLLRTFIDEMGGGLG